MNRKPLLLISFLATFIILCVSCQKSSLTEEIIPKSKGEKYKVDFAITAFSKKEIPLSGQSPSARSSAGNASSAKQSAANEDAVDQYIKMLDFFIYDSNGELVERLCRPNEYLLTGKYNETYFLLEEGSYRMIIIGSMGGLKYHDTTNYSTAYFEPKVVVEDIFYKEHEFNVNASDIVSNTVNLERIVGSLEVRDRTYPRVNVQPDLPSVYANSVNRFPFDPNGTYHYVYDGYPDWGIIFSQHHLPKIAGELEFGRPVDVVYRGFILPNRSGAFNCDPWMYIPASRSGIIPGPEMGDVVIKPNVKVILSGRGYGAQGGEFVKVTADSTWTETETKEF